MEVNASRLVAEVAEAEVAGVVEVAEDEVEVAVNIFKYSENSTRKSTTIVRSSIILAHIH